ncbi:chalcone-flavanone isomerase, partial [Backusella circina FSU 941]
LQDPATKLSFPIYLNTDSEWKRLIGLGDFDKSKFLEDSALANKLLDQPYDVSIRLVPVRATNTQHLRDGFLRLLLQRMRDQSLSEDEEKEILGAISEFKSNFVSMRVPKDTEFIFTKTKEGGLKMSYEDRDFGTVNNKWLAKNFLMSYLEPEGPSSEAAFHDIADGFERLMKEEEK